MPIDRLLLILVVVILAAGATVWLGVLIAGHSTASPSVGLVLLPVVLGVALIWRVIAARGHGPK